MPSDALTRTGILSTEIHEEPYDFVKPASAETVQEPPYAYFIQGSTLREMNGVYMLRPSTWDPKFEAEDGVCSLLYYANVDNMWSLELVKRTDMQRKAVTKEWILVDERGDDRFVQERTAGTWLVPGAGLRWRHVHHTAGPGGMLQVATQEPEALIGNQLQEGVPDDEDELPWQVVALLNRETMLQVFEGNDAHKLRKREEAMLTNGAGATTLRPPAAEDDPTGLIEEPNHYTVLGVAPTATEETIQRAYRVASLAHHPDRKHGSVGRFQRVQVAYEVLSDVLRRRAFDEGAKVEKELAAEEEVFAWKQEYCPFGDPFVIKRKLRRERQQAQAAKEKAKEKAKASPPSKPRAAAPPTPPPPPPVRSPAPAREFGYFGSSSTGAGGAMPRAAAGDAAGRKGAVFPGEGLRRAERSRVRTRSEARQWSHKDKQQTGVSVPSPDSNF